jgi:hypothetical protein
VAWLSRVTEMEGMDKVRGLSPFATAARFAITPTGWGTTS